MASTDIQYKTLNQLVQLQLNYIAANAPTTLTLPLGPFVTAICYATAFVALVLQRLVQLVLKASRLSTATGDDVDSFIADFGMSPREEGTKARGTVTVSKLVNAPSAIFIPNGSLFKTASSPALKFYAVADTTKSGYSAVDGGYFLAAGNTSVDITVEAELAGTEYNVGVGQISVIGSSIPGVDSAANGAAFATGADAETDAEVKLRFVNYIQGLSKATTAAISAALDTLGTDVSHSISEYNGPGDTPDGTISVYIDDGYGTAGSLVASASAAIDAVRPAGIRVDVVAATPVQVYVLARIDVKKNFTQDLLALEKVLRSAVVELINAGKIPGDTLHISTLYRAIFNAASDGTDISTTIALVPSSTTTVLNVASTLDMSVGQSLEISGYTTLSKKLPTVQEIVSETQIRIDPPLTAAPIAGTVVRAFSITDEQITDIHGLLLLKAATASTTTIAGSTASKVYVSSTTGILAGHKLIITNESNPSAPVCFVPDIAVNDYPSVASVGSDGGGAFINLSSPVGVMNSDSTWTSTAPPTGCKVVAVDSTTNSNGSADVVPATNEVVRIKAVANNSILLKLEPE